MQRHVSPGLSVMLPPKWFWVLCGAVTLACEWNSALSLEKAQDPSQTYREMSSAPSHKLLKRELKCGDEDEYSAENRHCCKNCPAGQYVKNDCNLDHGIPDCAPCMEGIDYMDKPNGYTICLRCSTCDLGLGEEINVPCTVTQNTICKCNNNYFCSTNTSQASSGCKNCQQCKQCELGVAERCTQTKDTVCKDIDLEPHLQDLSDKINYNELVKCVRKLKIHPSDVDAIKNDNADTHERKYQLLSCWYTQHGRIGAFRELIKTLRDLRLNSVADDFVAHIKRVNRT
ncbi:hypothetical protein GDO86_013458 [Hymenochirus boettgeri]|uniref:Tumor necrosis factor receptor superfamily member 6 n=1 Tax=Hymenochirus boettgeri TaxID=247094 RepID=A0A8T2IVE8_9PIPI|nr:hypothetical protein GDO86_013458 [Hymenochirus boettgeri]